jgi:hypothetical protein
METQTWLEILSASFDVPEKNTRIVSSNLRVNNCKITHNNWQANRGLTHSAELAAQSRP